MQQDANFAASLLFADSEIEKGRIASALFTRHQMTVGTSVLGC